MDQNAAGSPFCTLGVSDFLIFPKETLGGAQGGGVGGCRITCVYSNAYMYKSESNSPLKVIDWWADHCALSGSAHEHAKGRQWRNQQFPSKVTDCWADHCALSCSSDH